MPLINISRREKMAKKPKHPTHVHAGNMQKMVDSYVGELVAVLAEEEPLKERRKDLLQSAKDNGLDSSALAFTAKFKFADAEKKRKAQERAQNIENYMSFVQLTLFPGESPTTPAQTDKTKH